jgi:Fe2+ or Zn2+ uptake regulation protein
MPRPSHVRPAIASLLSGSNRHGWSLEEIAAGLRERGVKADFSSVFRGVTRLVEDGALAQVELGDGKARFEATSSHHEHVRCYECGTVAEVPGCLVAGAIPAVERQTGFAITDHRLLLSGICGSCSSGGGR